jgi:hypothetical protein
MAFTPIAVTGRFLDPDDATPADGQVEFSLTEPISDTVTNETLTTRPIVVPIDETGRISKVLAANDDASTEPTGTGYRVKVRVKGAPDWKFTVVIPHNAIGGTIDLADLAPAMPAGLTTYALESAFLSHVAGTAADNVHPGYLTSLPVGQNTWNNDQIFGAGPWVDLRYNGRAPGQDATADLAGAAAKAPGGTVFIPLGTWIISGALGASISNIPNLTIKGAGWGSLLQRSADATAAERRIMTATNCAGLELCDFAVDVNNVDRYGGFNIHLSDRLRAHNVRLFDSNLKNTYNTYDHDGFVIDQCNNVEIWECLSEDVELVEIDRTTNFKIHHNTVVRPRGAGGIVSATVSSGETVTDGLIEGNIVVDPSGVAVTFQHEATGLNNGTWKRITVKGTKVFYTTIDGRSAVRFGNFTGTASTGNVHHFIDVVDTKVYIDAGRNITVPLIWFNEQPGNNFLYSTVTDNKTYGAVTGDYAMSLNRLSKSTVGRNKIYGAANGMSVVTFDNSVLEDNEVEATGTAYNYNPNNAGDNNKVVRNGITGNPATRWTVANVGQSGVCEHVDAVTAANGDTSPSVGGVRRLTFANTAGTTVTRFDDALPGQLLTCFVDANTTLQDGANLKLAGNFTGGANSAIVLAYSNAGGADKWQELSRVTAG